MKLQPMFKGLEAALFGAIGLKSISAIRSLILSEIFILNVSLMCDFDLDRTLVLTNIARKLSYVRLIVSN